MNAFGDWLHQQRDTRDEVGELARFLDYEAERPDTYEEARLTLIHTNAGQSMFDALDTAQRAYERAQAQAQAAEEAAADRRWYAAMLPDATLLHEPSDSRGPAVACCRAHAFQTNQRTAVYRVEADDEGWRVVSGPHWRSWVEGGGRLPNGRTLSLHR